MLKIMLAVLAVAFAAFALWRQTVRARPSPYTKIRIVAHGAPAHPEIEEAIAPPMLPGVRRKQALTPIQLGAGLAFCASLYAALAVSAVMFTHQHFRVSANHNAPQRPGNTDEITPSAP